MLIYAAGFVGMIVVIQRALRSISDYLIAFDHPYYWPVSVFRPRLPTFWEATLAVLVIASFFLIVRFLESKHFSLGYTIGFGAVLIAGLTLTQGIDAGFYAPIAGDAQTGVLIPFSTDGQEYFHDAAKVSGPVDFLSRYNEIQPTLHRHSHTHPPGAVLTFYFLEKLFRDPGIISLVVMLIAAPVTGFFFFKLLRTELADETARFFAFLILLLPVVQIYYLASLDALITALLTGTIYFFCFGSGRKAIAGAAAMLSASFLMTFGSLFILPVMAGYDLVVRRSVRKTLIVLGAVAAVHLLLYLATGYNVLGSFRTASIYENPKGFMLFVDPVNYLFTRVEDIAEIIFFLGPFILILMWRGLKGFGLRPLDVLTALGFLSLLAMFAAGAWRTGETARACAFIYPYLLFPVARYFEGSDCGKAERFQLAAVVFIQSAGMQVFGTYFW